MPHVQHILVAYSTVTSAPRNLLFKLYFGLCSCLSPILIPLVTSTHNHTFISVCEKMYLKFRFKPVLNLVELVQVGSVRVQVQVQAKWALNQTELNFTSPSCICNHLIFQAGPGFLGWILKHVQCLKSILEIGEEFEQCLHKVCVSHLHAPL